MNWNSFEKIGMKYRKDKGDTNSGEIIIFFCMIASLFFFKTPFSFLISFLFFSTFLEYELNVKHYSIPVFHTILYLTIDIVHVSIFLISTYLILTSGCNFKKIILLNTLFLMILFSFFHFKICVLTLLQNKLIKKNIAWTGPFQRISYFFDTEQPYIEKNPTMKKWINSNKISCFFIILANLYCLCFEWLNFIR